MTKPSLQPLKIRADESFASYWVKANSFGFHWHYHPEIELCYIHKGAGTRMVGDSVRAFSEGDLVLVGSNLPHTWISHHYTNNNLDNMEVFVVQFLPEIIPLIWLSLPEFRKVSSLMKEASQGIFFKNIDTLKIKLLAVDNYSGIDKLLRLLELLDQLSLETDIEKLASHNYSPFLY